MMMQLLGSAASHRGISLSRDEYQAVNKLYGFTPEKPNQRPLAPTPPVRSEFEKEYEFREALKKHEAALSTWQKWEDPIKLMQAGADRNVMRHVESDGFRLAAWIAKYVPRGEDPLKTLVQMAVASGFDVDPSDIEWAEIDSEDEEP